VRAARCVAAGETDTLSRGPGFRAPASGRAPSGQKTCRAGRSFARVCRCCRNRSPIPGPGVPGAGERARPVWAKDLQGREVFRQSVSVLSKQVPYPGARGSGMAINGTRHHTHAAPACMPCAFMTLGDACPHTPHSYLYVYMYIYIIPILVSIIPLFTRVYGKNSQSTLRLHRWCSCARCPRTRTSNRLRVLA